MGSNQKRLRTEAQKKSHLKSAEHFDLWKKQVKSDFHDPAIVHLMEASSGYIDGVIPELKYRERYQRELLETFVDVLAPTWTEAQHTYMVREYLRDEYKFSPKTKLMSLYGADGKVQIPEHPVAVEIYRKQPGTDQYMTKVMVFDFDAKKSAGADGMKIALNEASAIFAFFAKIGCSNIFMDRSDTGGYHVIVPLGQWKSYDEIRLTLDSITTAVKWETLDTTVMTSRKSCLTVPGSPNKSGNGFRVLTHSDFVPSNPIFGGRDEPIMFKDFVTMGSSRSILSEVRRKMKNIGKLRNRPVDDGGVKLAEFRAAEYSRLNRSLTRFHVPDELWRGYSSTNGSGLGGMKRREFIESALERAAKSPDNSQARMIISTMVYKLSNGIFDLFARKLLATDPNDETDYKWLSRFHEAKQDQERHLQIEFRKAEAWSKESGWIHTGAYLTSEERSEFKIEGFAFKPSVIGNMGLPAKAEIQAESVLPTPELRRGFAWDMRMLRMKYNGAFMGKRFNDDKELLEGFYRAAAFIHNSKINDLETPFELSATFLARFTGWQVKSAYDKAFDASLPFCRRFDDGSHVYHNEVEVNEDGEANKIGFAAPVLLNASMPTAEDTDLQFAVARNNLKELTERADFISETLGKALKDAEKRLLEISEWSSFHQENILDGHGGKPREQNLRFFTEDKKTITMAEAKSQIVDSLDDNYIRDIVNYLLTSNVLNAAEIEESVSFTVRNSGFAKSLDDELEFMTQEYKSDLESASKSSLIQDFMIADKLKKFEQIAYTLLSNLISTVVQSISTTIHDACADNSAGQSEQGMYFIEQKADYDNTGVSRIFRSPLHENRELELSEALQSAAVLISQTTFYDGFMDEANLQVVRGIRNERSKTDLSFDVPGFQKREARTTTALNLLNDASDSLIQFLETFYSFKSQRVSAYAAIDCAPVEGNRRLPVSTISQLHTGRQISDTTSGEKSNSLLEYTSVWTYLAPPAWFTSEEDLDTAHVEPLWSQHDKKHGLSTLHRDVHAFLLGEKKLMNSWGQEIDFAEYWSGQPLVDKEHEADGAAFGVTIQELSSVLNIAFKVLRGIVNDLERIGLIESKKSLTKLIRKTVFRSMKDQLKFDRARRAGATSMDAFWTGYRKDGDSELNGLNEFSEWDGLRITELKSEKNLNPAFPVSSKDFDIRDSEWGTITRNGKVKYDHGFAETDISLYQKRYTAAPLEKVNLPFLFQQTRSWHAYLNSNDLRSVLRFEKMTDGGSTRLADFKEKSQRLGVSMKDFDYLANSFVAVADPFSKEADAIELNYLGTLKKSHKALESHLAKTAKLSTFRSLTRSVTKNDKFKRSRDISEQVQATALLNKVWNGSLFAQFDSTELFDRVLDAKLTEYAETLEIPVDDTDYEFIEFMTYGKNRLYWIDANSTGIIEYWTRWLVADPEDRDLETEPAARKHHPEWDWGRSNQYEAELHAPDEAFDLAA